MKAYLINLDRSPERLAFFSQQAAKAGITFERVSAVDGRKGDVEAIRSHIGKSFEFQPVSLTEAALFLSHRACWQRLIDSGEAFGAVFEDDAVLSENLGAVLDSIDRLKVDAGIVKLETTGRKVAIAHEGLAVDGTDLCRLLSWHGGTAAYVVSRGAAQKLLSLTHPVTDPVDQTLFHPLSKISSGLTILQAIPAPAIQFDILHPEQKSGALASTIGRKNAGFSLFRHGPWIDLRRAWMKHSERRLRSRAGSAPGNRLLVVPFAGKTATVETSR